MESNVEKSKPKTKNKTQKKKIISISVLVIGLIVLVVGVVFLALNLVNASKSDDGEFLTKVEDWSLEGEEGVIWDFTEIGKGTLTTNNHKNDYSFIWALEDGKLLIETDWLYNLENEYEYSLDQGSGVLTLTADDKIYKFVANR